MEKILISTGILAVILKVTNQTPPPNDSTLASTRANPASNTSGTTSSSCHHNSKLFFWLAIIGIVAGIGFQFYLASLHYPLKFGMSTGSICSINETFDCEAVAASRYAELFGVPLAIWGAVTNLVLLCLVLLFPLSEETRKPIARKNILALAGFIATMSVVMGAVSLLKLNTFCLFCILAYVASFIAFAGLYCGLNTGATAGAPSKSSVIPRGPAYQPTDAKTLIAAGVSILILSFITNHGFRRGYVKDTSELNATINASINEWLSNPKLTIEPVAPFTKGATPADAKMTLVEFADFRCPHCKHAVSTVHAFVKSRPDVRFIFQVWPLDGECNTKMESSNGASCLLARAAVCANQRDKGWAAHDWIFEHQEQFSSLDAVKGKMPELAKAVGLNEAEFQACTDAEETRNLVKQMADVGTKIEIRGTPAFYANGRHLPGGQLLPVLAGAYERVLSGEAP